MSIHPKIAEMEVTELDSLLQQLAQSKYSVIATDPLDLPERTKREILSELANTATKDNKSLSEVIADSGIFIMPSTCRGFIKERVRMSEYEQFVWVLNRNRQLVDETMLIINGMRKALDVFEKAHNDLLSIGDTSPANIHRVNHNIENFMRLSMALQQTFGLRGMHASALATLRDLNLPKDSADYKDSISCLNQMGATKADLAHAHELAKRYREQ